MSTPHYRLGLLRDVFVGFFLLSLAIGLWTSVNVTAGLPLPIHGHRIGGQFFQVLIIGGGVVVGGGILALALLVFNQLGQGKEWARLLLLITGWVEGASGVISLVSAPVLLAGNGLLGRLVPEFTTGQFQSLLAISLVSNGLKVAFAAYLIWTLQFDPEVKALFRPSSRLV